MKGQHFVPCGRCGGPVDTWFPQIEVLFRRRGWPVQHTYPRMCEVYLMLPPERRGIPPVEALDATREAKMGKA